MWTGFEKLTDKDLLEQLDQYKLCDQLYVMSECIKRLMESKISHEKCYKELIKECKGTLNDG